MQVSMCCFEKNAIVKSKSPKRHAYTFAQNPLHVTASYVPHANHLRFSCVSFLTALCSLTPTIQLTYMPRDCWKGLLGSLCLLSAMLLLKSFSSMPDLLGTVLGA